MTNSQFRGKKVLLIINPKAGKTKPMSVLSEVLGIFTAAGCKTDALSTRGRGDATTYVKEYAAKYDLVVCCGGDGTLNEILNGVMSLKKPLPIGYIPTGTTNDFASTMGLSLNLEQAARDVLNGRLVPHDIGRFNGDTHFTYIATFGSMAEVAHITSQKMKNRLGHAAYILEGSKSFFNMRPYHMTLEFEGKVAEGDFILGNITNTHSIGGLIHLKDRRVKLDDGVFEILFFRKPKGVKDAANIARWLLTQNENNPIVIYGRAKSVVLTAPEYVSWTLDGEFGGYHKRVEIEACHHAVRFIVPQ